MDLVFQAIKTEFDRRQSLVQSARRPFMGVADAKSGIAAVWTRTSTEDQSAFGDSERSERQTWTCRLAAAPADGERCADMMRLIADTFRNVEFSASDLYRIGMHLTDRSGPVLEDDRMVGILTFDLVVDWRL